MRAFSLAEVLGFSSVWGVLTGEPWGGRGASGTRVMGASGSSAVQTHLSSPVLPRKYHWRGDSEPIPRLLKS